MVAAKALYIVHNGDGLFAYFDPRPSSITCWLALWTMELKVDMIFGKISLGNKWIDYEYPVSSAWKAIQRIVTSGRAA